MPLSSSDFPVLSVPELSEPTLSPRLALEQPAEPPAVDDEVKAKAERKAEKKAAAVERAAERARVAQEKAAARAAERARVAAEKTAEKERAVAAKVLKEKEEKERLEQDKLAKVKERAEKAERERVEKARLEKEKQEKERLTAVASAEKQASLAKDAVPRSARGANPSQSDPARNSSPSKAAAAAVDGPQVPLLSKMPKKHKPATKPIRIPKEGEIVHETSSTVPSTTTVDAPGLPYDRHHQTVEPEPTNGGLYRMDTIYNDRASLEDLLDQIDTTQPWMNLLYHPFFDISKINPAGKMPLEYGPLVHALSALSVGGGSFANNMPSGSIDNAVSSFQQLLETLTQTISDLLRLLPRTTWDDSSSFDGVLRDMLKGDDFLDDGGEDGSGRDDEVAALTLALERRARWMEVQLSKLEELHRDINTAAVRAVLSFNDRGWDKHGFLPRNGNTLARFDNLALVQLEDGSARPMTADELESKLVVANEAAVFAETELRESMERMQGLRMLDEDY
jgi:CCR4-NOT transcription complex subunit 4